MPKKYLVPAIFAATILAHDITTQIRARKFRLAASDVIELQSIQIEIMTKGIESLDAKRLYLCHVLKENGIEPDEFDAIALNYHDQ